MQDPACIGNRSTAELDCLCPDSHALRAWVSLWNNVAFAGGIMFRAKGACCCDAACGGMSGFGPCRARAQRVPGIMPVPAFGCSRQARHLGGEAVTAKGTGRIAPPAVTAERAAQRGNRRDGTIRTGRFAPRGRGKAQGCAGAAAPIARGSGRGISGLGAQAGGSRAGGRGDRRSRPAVLLTGNDLDPRIGETAGHVCRRADHGKPCAGRMPPAGARDAPQRVETLYIGAGTALPQGRAQWHPVAAARLGTGCIEMGGASPDPAPGLGGASGNAPCAFGQGRALRRGDLPRLGRS